MGFMRGSGRRAKCMERGKLRLMMGSIIPGSFARASSRARGSITIKIKAFIKGTGLIINDAAMEYYNQRLNTTKVFGKMIYPKVLALLFGMNKASRRELYGIGMREQSIITFDKDMGHFSIRIYPFTLGRGKTIQRRA